MILYIYIGRTLPVVLQHLAQLHREARNVLVTIWLKMIPVPHSPSALCRWDLLILLISRLTVRRLLPCCLVPLPDSLTSFPVCLELFCLLLTYSQFTCFWLTFFYKCRKLHQQLLQGQRCTQLLFQQCNQRNSPSLLKLESMHVKRRLETRCFTTFCKFENMRNQDQVRTCDRQSMYGYWRSPSYTVHGVTGVVATVRNSGDDFSELWGIVYFCPVHCPTVSSGWLGLSRTCEW